MKAIVRSLLCMAAAGSAWAQNPLDALDDAIYAMKCLGAEDKEACKAKARKAFEDYQRQKQSGGPSAATIGTSSSARTSTEKCQSVSAKGPVDVDTAYARAITTFGFQTHEEKTHYGQKPRVFTVLDDGYKHVRTPGALYDMWDHIHVFWPARNTTVHFTGSTRLTKEGNATRLAAKYCLIREVDPEFGDPAFWQFADEAFRSLVQ